VGDAQWGWGSSGELLVAQRVRVNAHEPHLGAVTLQPEHVGLGVDWMHALRRDERASEGTEVVLVLLQGHDVNVSHPAEDGKNLLAAAAPHPQEDGACRLEPQKLAHPRNRHRRSANRILHDRSRARRLLERHAVAALFLLLGRLLQMHVLLFPPRHVFRAAEGGREPTTIFGRARKSPRLKRRE
jgi:hypothetical protein